MPNNDKSSHLLALLSLSVALSLAACGGGGGSTDNPTVTATAVPAVAASAPDPDAGPPAADLVVADKQIAEASAAQADGAVASVAPVADVSLPSVPPPAETVVVADPAPIVTALAVPTAAPAATTPPASTSLDIFVANNGNDAWSGMTATANAGLTDGPVRTITAAQAIARTRLAAMVAGATRLPINVRIAAGEYRLTAPLTFGPTDSGVPGAAVVYRAETAGTVTLSGALRVGTAAATGTGQVLALPAPALDLSNMRGASQLYVNARRATLARTPNVGNYWFVTKAVPLPTDPVDKIGQEAFESSAAAAAAIAALSPAERSQAVINVMQSWSSGAHRVSSLATPAGSIRLSPRALWPFLKYGTDQRVYLENVASALDAPGEWLWDTSGLRYISTAADAGQALAFDMPQLDKLLVIKGNATTSAWVQDLEFRGLGFAYTRHLVPDAGLLDGQAGVAVGAAVEVDAARRIVIDNCTVAHTGGYAVWLRTAVRDSQVSNCRMTDLGAGGVKVGLALQSSTDVNGTAFNTVQANSIIDTGKLTPGSVGVWVGQSSDNTVANNLIANTTYTGISVGWNWNYASSNAYRNKITSNLLVNIGLGQLSDMGAIYTLGESTGTVISGNVIHEVRPYPGYGAGAWGLYNDGASTGVLWEKNIVVGTNDGGYLLNFGRNNTVRSNVLAFGDRGEVRVSRSDPANTKLTFDGNTLIPKNTAPLVAFASAPDVNYTANLVSGRVLATPADITKCGAGCARATTMISVGTDPRVISLSGADAATTAWVPLIAAASGPPGLAANAIPVVNATLPPTVAAPPVGYTAEIAETVIGAQPFNLRYTGGGASNISVQAATGTPSGKSLRFIDSASIVNRWEPYAWATLNHKTATTVVEFSITIDAASNFLHEWRDDANSYLTGPSLRVKPTGIEVAGRVVAKAPVGQWIGIKITAPLGTAAGAWTLVATYADGTSTTVSNLANKNPGWQRLNWLGFVSDAAVSSTSNVGYILANNSAAP